ncbi:MAG: Nif3-like dinuclear metal center hexameric protein [Aeriscardovia sp.]|nr:Nif3-like dinuclear metal center hexameric protein [Aeriscardovia sp.]
MKVKDAVKGLEEMYPLDLREEWDHPGLALGNLEGECKKICFALDPTIEVAKEAAEWGADLLVTHHPLFFRAVHLLPSTDPHGRAASILLRAGCALWVGHTNVDAAPRGTNEALCARLGLLEALPIESKGLVGGAPAGLGRVGELEHEMNLEEFAKMSLEELPKTVQGVKLAGDPKMRVKRVAVMSGAGDGFFEQALESEADVFLTSDLRHHPALDFMQRLEALGRKMGLVDVSHFSSESPWFDFALEDAEKKFEGRAQLRLLERNTDPWAEAFI